jgi:hypothetical protein
VLFPESLFKLSARDQQVTWLDPVILLFTTTLAAVTVNSTFDVPDGRCLILFSGHCLAIPGAAQSVTRTRIVIRNPSQNYIDLDSANINPPLAANAWGNAKFHGQLMMPDGWQLRAEAEFSAGAAANRVDLSVVGLLIPIGNIQRV